MSGLSTLGMALDDACSGPSSYRSNSPSPTASTAIRRISAAPAPSAALLDASKSTPAPSSPPTIIPSDSAIYPSSSSIFNYFSFRQFLRSLVFLFFFFLLFYALFAFSVFSSLLQSHHQQSLRQIQKDALLRDIDRRLSILIRDRPPRFRSFTPSDSFAETLTRYLSWHAEAVAFMSENNVNISCVHEKYGLRLLYLHPFGGFGNRALPAVSAFLMAVLTGRVFFLSWTHHGVSRGHDFFEPYLPWFLEDFPVLANRPFVVDTCHGIFAQKDDDDRTSRHWPTEELSCKNYDETFPEDVIDLHANQYFLPLILHNPNYRSLLKRWRREAGGGLFAPLASALFALSPNVRAPLEAYRRDFVQRATEVLRDRKDAARLQVEALVQRDQQRVASRMLLPGLSALIAPDAAAAAAAAATANVTARFPFYPPLLPPSSPLSPSPPVLLRVAVQLRSLHYRPDTARLTLSASADAFFTCADLLGSSLLRRFQAHFPSAPAPTVLFHVATEDTSGEVRRAAEARWGRRAWVIPVEVEKVSHEADVANALAELSLLAESNAILTSSGSTYGYAAGALHEALFTLASAASSTAADAASTGSSILSLPPATLVSTSTSPVHSRLRVDGWSPRMIDGQQMECVHSEIPQEPCCHFCRNWIEGRKDGIRTAVSCLKTEQKYFKEMVFENGFGPGQVC